MREKKQSEERAERAIELKKVETPYDNVIETLYPYREPLERLMSAIKKAAVLAGVVALGIYTMTVGDMTQSDRGQQITENLLGKSAQIAVGWLGKVEQKTEKEKKSGGRTLSISVVDELPPEDELEVRIIGEDHRITGEESDGVFSQSTTLIDTGHDTVRLLQEDGSIKEDEGIQIELNTVKFFVPEGGSRAFGIPNFSTTIFGEGEWEKKQEMDEINVAGDDCEEFNAGIDHARQLIKEGFLDDEISELLAGYPEIDPFGREYTLKLTYAGETYREEDETKWWDVDYSLYTTADNGEVIMPLTVEIYDITMSNGMSQDWDDAHYRLWAYENQLWRLIEDPVKDKGEVILHQVLGDSFADEESVRKFVEDYGVSFFLPAGADTKVTWSCQRQEEFYYDYLVWEGETADYSVMLAIPLMEKKDEGYYLVSYVRKEAEDKATCRHILSGMMQTLRGRSYLHVVKEGEALSLIAQKYTGSQYNYPQMLLYNEADGSMEAFDDPDLIYPGQKVYISVYDMFKYDAGKVQAQSEQTKKRQ